MLSTVPRCRCRARPSPTWRGRRSLQRRLHRRPDPDRDHQRWRRGRSRGLGRVPEPDDPAGPLGGRGRGQAVYASAARPGRRRPGPDPYRDHRVPGQAFSELFAGRKTVPKTLVFARDDSHADDIVQMVREVFAKGNEFATKITYRTRDGRPQDLLQSFRNSLYPRIVVTVDMIATGTDVKPLECLLFMRSVKSRTTSSR